MSTHLHSRYIEVFYFIRNDDFLEQQFFGVQLNIKALIGIEVYGLNIRFKSNISVLDGIDPGGQSKTIESVYVGYSTHL